MEHKEDDVKKDIKDLQKANTEHDREINKLKSVYSILLDNFLDFIKKLK